MCIDFATGDFLRMLLQNLATEEVSSALLRHHFEQQLQQIEQKSDFMTSMLSTLIKACTHSSLVTYDPKFLAFTEQWSTVVRFSIQKHC